MVFHVFIFFSETTVEILTKLCRNVNQILYQICVFCADQKFKMAAIANISFNIEPYVDFTFSSSSLKQL